MHARTCKQYTFNAMHFDENSFTCRCNKEGKKAEGFQIWHFYRSFSSDVMAAKGLGEGLTNRNLYPMSKERKGGQKVGPKFHNPSVTPPSLRLSTPLIQQGCSVS